MKKDVYTTPYNSSYDRKDDYHMTLFKAGFPVQARELNDVQLYTKEQLEQLSDTVFKNGSIVTGSTISLCKTHYITVDEDVQIKDYIDVEGVKLVGTTSEIEALIINYTDKTKNDPLTIYVKYTKVGIDGKTNKFIDGEVINIVDKDGNILNTITMRCPTCQGVVDTYPMDTKGFGYIFYITEGTIYFEGRFLDVRDQSIIVSKYDEPYDVKIGLDVNEVINSYKEDANLLDNSLGYPNATGYGADRLKITLDLVSYPNTTLAGENFILMMSINEAGYVDYERIGSDYSQIMDEVALRFYETNGNYTIRPYRISFLEHFKENREDTKGYSLQGSKDNLVARITPSISYVSGHRIENKNDRFAVFRKARDTKKYEKFVKRFEERTYVDLVSVGKSHYPNALNTPSTLDSSIIELYNTRSGDGEIKGNKIGYARISDMKAIDRSKNIYRYYFYDIHLDNGRSIEEVKSVSNLGAQFVADVRDKFNFSLINNGQDSLIFSLGKGNIKSTRSVHNQNNGSIIIKSRKLLRGTINPSGVVTFDSQTNEFFESIDSGTIAHIEENGIREPITLDDTNTTVTATTMSIDVGASNAGKTLTVLHTIQQVAQKEKTKSLVDTKMITKDAPPVDVGSRIGLKKGDVLRIKSIDLHIENANGDLVLVGDVSDKYKFHQNITKYAYNESEIELIEPYGQGEITNNHRLIISFDYFSHSGTGGFFTIDSYNDVFNDDTNDVTYENLPNFKQGSDEYDLRECIDFRQLYADLGTAKSYLPKMNDTMLFDIEYYLPRACLLLVNREGVFYVKEGVSSDKPVLPKVDENSMALYEIHLSPYVYSHDDIRVSFIENKRYTMRDIGALEKRISNIEYYTALSMLEKATLEMNVKDKDGLDRFKNGVFADDFKQFQLGDLENIEFRSAIDKERAELRPRFRARSNQLALNVKQSLGRFVGGVATLPYKEVLEDEQPYATKSISVTPYLQTQIRGVLSLSPNNDVWSDTHYKPDKVVNINNPAEIRNVDESREVWGSWGQSTISTFTTTGWGRDGEGRRTAPFFRTIGFGSVSSAKPQDTIKTTETVESRVDSSTTTDTLEDVQLQLYMRPKIVAFYASGLSPNTVFYPFFDDTPVTPHCRDITYQLDPNFNPNSIVPNRVVWGGQLVSNSSGELLGEFRIPEETFFNGQREFVLTTNDSFDILDDEDLSWSIASAEYYAGGLTMNRQRVTENIITPVITRTTTGTRYLQKPQSPPRRDPIAQAIPPFEESGFLASLDLYFQQVDVNSESVWVEIRTVENGYPTEEVIARKNYARGTLNKIPTSSDASKPFNVKLDYPVYLDKDRRYCFVVGSDSPANRIFVARLGQQLVDDRTKKLEHQPNLQSMFKSINGETWTAEQFETVKYKLYTCEFDTSNPLKLVFNQENRFEELGANAVETGKDSNRVRVHIPEHGFRVDDRFDLSLLGATYIPFNVNGKTPPVEGQRVVTDTFEGTIYEVKPRDVLGVYDIRFVNTKGKIIKGQDVSFKSHIREVEPFMFISAGNEGFDGKIRTPDLQGTVHDDYTDRYPSNVVNGIPLDELNTTHVVKEVDTLNSVIIETRTPANRSGYIGKDREITIDNVNHRFDVYNINGNFIDYDIPYSTQYRGVFMREEDGLVAEPIDIHMSSDMFLGKPHRILGKANEEKTLAGQKSIEFTQTFFNENPRLSPVVNLETYNIVTVSNIIGNSTKEQMNVEPNAENRYVDETHKSNGTELFKYVTKEIRLANPAEDIMIAFDVYRDLEADFDVYLKVVNETASQTIDDVDWIKFNIDKTYFSKDLDDRVEYELKTSEDIDGWVDDLGMSKHSFTSFKFKIVGKSANSCKPPLFANFRGLAVT